MSNDALINEINVDGPPPLDPGAPGVIVVEGWYDSAFGTMAYLFEYPPTFGCAGIACVPYERRTVRIGCGASSIVPC